MSLVGLVVGRNGLRGGGDDSWADPGGGWHLTRSAWSGWVRIFDLEENGVIV